MINNSLTKSQVIAKEIQKWLKSESRERMIVGEKYYIGEHDILYEKREVIGDDGKLKPVDNLPDARIVDNQYARIVDQKVNYSVGNTITYKSNNKEYKDKVAEVLDDEFMRVMRILTTDAYNGGIAWLHPYYSSLGDGELKFKVFKPYEVLPFWKDNEHSVLDFAVRVYFDQVYEGEEEVDKTRVEIYTEDGVYRYNLDEEEDIPDLRISDDLESFSPYMSRRVSDEEIRNYSWGEVPLIPWKYNNKELPLIVRGKSLQDALNRIMSNFVNNTLEDPRNSILVVHNYDGENLGTFRHNLAQYGAVKVRSGEGAKGGVDVLTVDVNPENYKAILNQLKTSLIENLRGVDGKNDKLTSGDVNQMHIQSMYNDIDLDASGLEIEFQNSLDKLMYFVDKHLAIKTDVKKDNIEFVFNRDILMNESEKIEDFVKSYGRLSDETAVANHPWVTDTDSELKQMKEDNSELDMFMKSVGKAVDRTEYNDGKKESRKVDDKIANRKKTELREEEVIK